MAQQRAAVLLLVMAAGVADGFRCPLVVSGRTSGLARRTARGCTVSRRAAVCEMQSARWHGGDEGQDVQSAARRSLLLAAAALPLVVPGAATAADAKGMVFTKTASGLQFAEDQLAIRGTQRFDINVHDVGNTTAAGPIVGLITAAS